jgi:hypothetical protein
LAESLLPRFFRDHDLPLKLAEVFDNKIYSPHIGIEFGSPARHG